MRHKLTLRSALMAIAIASAPALIAAAPATVTGRHAVTLTVVANAAVGNTETVATTIAAGQTDGVYIEMNGLFLGYLTRGQTFFEKPTKKHPQDFK